MSREIVSFECATCGSRLRARPRPDGRVKCPKCENVQSPAQGGDEPERPRKRRRKRSRSASRLPLLVAGSALGVVALGVLIVVAAVFARGRKPGAAEQREHSNTVFSVRYSSDWSVDHGGMPMFEWATFSKGSAKIKIRIHAADALARATGIVPADPRLAARQFHMDRKSTYEEEFGSGYDEDEEPKEIATEAGTGFRSNFRAKAMFGSLKGVRATILGFVQINITAQCSAGDWATFEPEFDRMIRSIGFPRVEPGGADAEDE